MPYGKMVLFPALTLTLAFILSIVTLVNCSFAKGDHHHIYIQWYDSNFKVGLWPGCFYQSRYYADEQDLMHAFAEDTNRKVSVAFGLIACIVGCASMISLWSMTFKMLVSKWFLKNAVVVAFISQLLTLSMFGTEYCKSFGCNLAWGGVVSITAAILWFIGAIGVCMIPNNVGTIYVAGGTAKVVDSEHFKDMKDGKDIPSNPDGTKPSKKPEGAFETLDI